jgi:hypothetical protein
MHRKVIKISSGGVHNICIVEPQPSSLLEDVYKQFINGLYTDVVFKGFYQTFNKQSSDHEQMSQHSYSDEEMKESGIDI